jgi:hypothetical protein
MSPLIGSVFAFLFAGMGVVALANPDWIVAQFDVERLTTAGRNEVRAVYGGFGLAVAGVLIVAVVTGDSHLARGIFLAIACALGGMALGRIYSFVVDDAPRGWFPTIFYCGVELLGAALLLVALADA